MTMRGLWQSLRALVRRRELETELDEELRFHLEREIEERVRRGASPEEARTEALRAFGGVERFQEQCRDVRGVRWLEDLAQDVRVGLRSLRKAPVFTMGSRSFATMSANAASVRTAAPKAIIRGCA